MRALLFASCAGCLAVPPASSEADGGAVSPACVPGSQLDLAYVSEIEVSPEVTGELKLTGLALIANPGIDTIVIGELTASPALDDHGVSADVNLEGASGVVLHPGEAKGALGDDAAAVVLMHVSEEWTDVGSLSLDASLTFPAARLGPGDPNIRFAVGFGDYEFPVSIRIVDSPLRLVDAIATPRTAKRISALCE